MEMSFVGENDVMDITENMMVTLFKDALDVDLNTPLSAFPMMMRLAVLAWANPIFGLHWNSWIFRTLYRTRGFKLFLILFKNKEVL